MKDLLLVVFISLSFLSWSQPEEHLERIKAEKVAFITQELELTAEDAQQFWPIYNEYSDKINTIRKSKHDLKVKLKNYKELSAQNQKEYISQIFKYESEEIEIRKDYLQKFETVVSTQKAVGVFVAEEKFKRHLLHKLKERSRKR